MVRADEACAMFNQHCEAAGWPMRSDPTLAFEATTLKEAVSVWRAAAENRTWPPRSALTPRAMKGFLTEVAVVDVVVFCSRVRYRPRRVSTTA